MFRYLAFIWDEANPFAREKARELRLRHTARALEWSWVLEIPGLAVSCAGVRAGSSEPYWLHGRCGVVLGKLFEAGNAACEELASASRPLSSALDEPTSGRLLQGGGRGLVERCWGRYVALWQDADAATHVLRDPSAGLPCLMLRHGGVALIFSSMEEVSHLALPPFEVCWDFLIASVCQARQHTHGTGLSGVLQVLGGERMTLDGERIARRFLWDPRQIARQFPIEDSAHATRALREAVRDAVHAWASSYRGLLLSLSGGLDSSIVMAALRDAPCKPRLTCFHYYPIGTDIDERPGAREVARSAGLPLIERARDPQLSLVPLTRIRASHQPGSSYLYHLEHGHRDAQLAAQHEAAAVLTGWGGDQLFFQDHALWAAADYAGRHPFSPTILRCALDCARMDQVSVWRVLAQCLGQHHTPDPRSEMLSYRQLLAPEVLHAHGDSRAFLHPLLRQTHGIPLGKLWHLQQLLAGPWEFYDPLGEAQDPETLAPLYSQPVIEVCLRICTDVLVKGGWPRAIARSAFRQDLPASVISRLHKGGIEDHIYQILRHNIVFVRELLLDGALVKQGILARGKLEQALSGGATRLQTGRAELLEYLGIEAWLRSWQGCTARPEEHERKEQSVLLC
jgi:asparagine synthase (glutamine-hydrolysing)